MVGILRLYQGGMGAGHLPDEGGVLDQSVLMLSALNLMAEFDRRLQDEKTGALLNEDDAIDTKAQKDAEKRSASSWGVDL